MPCQKSAAAHIMNKISDHAAALRREGAFHVHYGFAGTYPQKKDTAGAGPWPEADRLPTPVVKRFTDLYGESVMARSEALRYHGTQLMAQAAQRLPAVVLRPTATSCAELWGWTCCRIWCRWPAVRAFTPLWTHAGADPAVWLGGEVNADAVTISPYYALRAAGEDKALFALIRTAEPGAAEVQNLMAGDRRLFLAAGRADGSAGGLGSWPRRITVWMCGSCGGG